MIRQSQIDLWADRLIKKMDEGDEELALGLNFIVNIKKRSDANNDTIIAVCGERGSGKSNVTMVCTTVLSRIGMQFSFDDSVFYGVETYEDYVSKMLTEKETVFDFDEGIRTANKKRSMSSKVVEFEEALTSVRKRNHAIFINIPKFSRLTTSVKNELVHFWIEVIDKSNSKEHDEGWIRCALCARDENPIIDDPWGILYLQKKLNKKKRMLVTTSHEKERVMHDLPSFLCYMKFPRLPKVLEDYYLESADEALSKWGRSLINKTQNVGDSTAIPPQK